MHIAHTAAEIEGNLFITHIIHLTKSRRSYIVYANTSTPSTGMLAIIATGLLYIHLPCLQLSKRWIKITNSAAG